MRTFLKDIRYGFRVSLQNRGVTLVAVFTLAIGIAASTAAFSWLDMMQLRPIQGVSRGSELVSFEGVAPDGGPLPTSYADFRDYRDHLTLISGLAASVPVTWSIGDADHADRVWGEVVSGNYFGVLGVRPILGRVFSLQEYGDKPGAYPVVVIGEALWKHRFNRDPRIIGQTLLVNHQPLTIVGVVGSEFHGSFPALYLELWAPITMASQLDVLPQRASLDGRGSRMYTALARLRPGVTMERAGAECAALARRLSEMYPGTNAGISATLLPVRLSHFGGQRTMEGPLRILMAASCVVFVIVCANVANLLLARATNRRKEFSLRMAMGAGRWRVVSHLLAESLVLAVMGVLAGVPLVMWMVPSLMYLAPHGAYIPVSLDIPLNSEILSFVLILCVAACVAPGIAPAFLGARVKLNEVLNEGSRSGSPGTRSQRLRGALVVCEVAMAVVAIIGAGLFVRSFQVASRIDPGFDARNILVARLEFTGTGYDAAGRRQICERLGRQIANQPGIAGVSWAEIIPLWFTGNPVAEVHVEGYVPGPTESMNIARNVVAPGYFSVLRIPVVEGREFDDHDTENSRRVIIVNQTFARRFFGGREALGRRVQASLGEWYTVVGVVRDSKYVKPTENAQPYFYTPLRQVFDGQVISPHIRTAGAPELAAGMLRRQVAAIDPAIRVFDPMPMTESISAGLFGERVAAALLACLGVFALLLAATGLYSVMVYAVAQRTQEIGIRMALGARPADVVRLVVRQGMILTLIGVAIGVALALGITRVVANLLVHVSANDPLVFLAGSLFLTAVALAANYVPARRATRIDPNDALRCQ
ncbi:MAG TPA: ABC transporter permease [Bryobacteraceae bacterium]|nr:ABC transporter permease [Bryobacteraceae bacterium]